MPQRGVILTVLLQFLLEARVAIKRTKLTWIVFWKVKMKVWRNTSRRTGWKCRRMMECRMELNQRRTCCRPKSRLQQQMWTIAEKRAASGSRRIAAITSRKKGEEIPVAERKASHDLLRFEKDNGKWLINIYTGPSHVAEVEM